MSEYVTSELSTLALIKKIVEELEEEVYEPSWWDFEEELNQRGIPFEVVHTAFEEGGRWSNYYERVVKIYESYLQITESVPATEIQEGQGSDGITDIIQVYPKQVVKTIYVANL